jgi:serine/threonine-protein kinase HipA
MAKNEIITVYCFNEEIGKLGFDENQQTSSFQYNPDFLNKGRFVNLFPATGIVKRIPQTQLFNRFNSETFRGLPPMIADSLPDLFGNIIFKKWLDANDTNGGKISVIEQLAYVGNRGMGALEYRPNKTLPQTASIDLEEIIQVLNAVMQNKTSFPAAELNHEALLNIFKMGSSAGGARPKILVAKHKKTGLIIPGDITHSDEYDHYLIKLALDDDELGYNREVIEYCYYQTALHLGINMMPSHLIEDKHFATQRFDRQKGQKKHVLTATGLTGWDFHDSKESTYENLFELAIFLKVPNKDREELFKRMVFNIVFSNTDDHLKNHSFIYNEKEDNWNLSPAYDLTYSLNPIINYKRTSRALSVNNKRVEITLEDVMKIADVFTIKNAKNSIHEVQESVVFWKQKAEECAVPKLIIDSILKDIKSLSES